MAPSPPHIKPSKCESQQDEVAELYSTLELAQHDETAKAPEYDVDASAFEFDANRVAPEVGRSACDLCNTESL